MDKNDKLFSELLYILHRNAISSFDKLDHVNCTQSDIASAKQFLDMVIMLKDKTRGNLSEELDKIQNMMLAEFSPNLIKSKINGSAK